MDLLALVTIEFAAVIHLMMAAVLFYFSRRRAMYRSQAWLMLLFGAFYIVGFFFVYHHPIPKLGILHPVLLMYLLLTSFLQSISPIGLSLPGYLQMKRIIGYATPAIGVIAWYLLGYVSGSTPVKVFTPDDIRENILSGDMLLRGAALGLSSYYIINIFRRPHLLVREFYMPRYLAAYGTFLSIISAFFVIITLGFHLILLVIYIDLFTIINMFLFFRILRPTLQSIHQPSLLDVHRKPSEEDIVLTEQHDFNEANLRRFEKLEYIMQNDKPYLDRLCNRDRLCRLAGFNRHLLLQCLRSQNFNNAHEYINHYRMEELKARVYDGKIHSIADCEMVGFGSRATVIRCFKRMEGLELEAFLAKQNKGGESEEEVENDADEGKE